MRPASSLAATSPRCAAIIVATACSARTATIDRSLAMLGGKSVITWSLEAFEAHARIHEIVLVVPSADTPTYQWLTMKHKIAKLSRVLGVDGDRQTSVQAGLRALGRADVVVVHDGGNPFVSLQEISAVVLGALEVGAAAVGEPCQGTLRKVGDDLLSDGTILRDDVWRMLTPQALRYELALAAYESAAAEGFRGHDDIELIERLGRKARVLRASGPQLTISSAGDLDLAEALLRCKRTRS
jgi:2-C-methyl-D-erythritol 4-phosphate cytidylyltransferase